MLKRSIGLMLGFVLVVAAPLWAQDDPTPPPYELPADHRLHVNSEVALSNQFLEWFYFTGVMSDQDGRIWGYQVTLFVGRFGDTPSFLYDVAISDVQTAQFWHYRAPAVLARYDDPDTGLIFDDEVLSLRYEAATDGWAFDFSAPMTTVDGQAAALVSLKGTLANLQKGYASHVPDNGVAPLGACGSDIETLVGYSYYYSHPRLSSNLVLRIDDAVYRLAGDTWFDHQWGNFAECYLGWNWFSLRFPDGGDVMIFQFVEADGSPSDTLLGASYIRPDGTVEFWLEPDHLTLTPVRTWENPRNGLIVPLDWVLDTPIGTFGIVPLFDDQMPITGEITPPYWEGVVSVRADGPAGEEISLGYLEVVPTR